MNAIKIIGDRAIALLTEAVYNPGSVKAGAVDLISAQWNQVSDPVDPALTPLDIAGMDDGQVAAALSPTSPKEADRG